MTEKDQKEFTFMSEQIKKKPFYKKKGFLKGISVSALAVLFGAVAGLTFSVVQPWAQRQFGQPEEPAQIVVVQEETETETETQTEIQSESETQTEGQSETENEPRELEISDYKILYTKMTEVAESVRPAIVTVTGESSNLDWFDEVIENQVQTSGLVIAQSKYEYYILTEQDVLQGAEQIIITFSNGSTANAQLQKEDEATGLAVVKVSKSLLVQGERENIKIAALCPDKEILQGEPVIALSSPVGNSSAIAVGMVTSVVDTQVVDAEYQLLTTDIMGNSEGSGILINLNGEIVGIIAQKFASGSEQITLTSLAVTEIRDLITALVNAQEKASLGIVGKEIDDTISKEFDMPKGIYVRSVEEDSPAMYANIITADIITSMDGAKILTMEDYEEELKKHEPEEIMTVGIKRSTMEGYVDMEVQVLVGR